MTDISLRLVENWENSSSYLTVLLFNMILLRKHSVITLKNYTSVSGPVVHTFNPVTGKAEAGESRVPGQPWQLREVLFQNKKQKGLRMKLRGKVPLCSNPLCNKEKKENLYFKV